jgi:hypothetical protein
MGTLEGHVASVLVSSALAGTGTPLGSVEIRVVRPGAATLAADLETGADGRFEATGLPLAEYRLEISKPGYMGSMEGGKKPKRKPWLRMTEQRCQ